ncbi:hypothetical protein HanOQP8_Chr11g0417081 [Helianthus annuus]|nr:hypothetical protein HanLR1_Chr11g0416071 [Helianthus annuus]KAJ0690365.1 hypothetical protein HanOQP8_Chr11g0417081 [Helianthus annuus]KAJ0876288.1 hypothetical protein HanPSC8_Chr11g0486741 [Helianthus annuus]
MLEVKIPFMVIIRLLWTLEYPYAKRRYIKSFETLISKLRHQLKLI